MDATVGTVKKNKSTDVVFELKAREEIGRNSLGVIDKRLFTGENKLHAIMDPQTTHWYLKYESGILPEPLKQRFTGWTPLFKFITSYFNKRNIDIVEVND